MAEPSRHVVEVRSATTTVTPGVNDALIRPAACSALAALIWAGNVTMTGGVRVVCLAMFCRSLRQDEGSGDGSSGPGREGLLAEGRGEALAAQAGVLRTPGPQVTSLMERDLSQAGPQA